MNMKDVICFFYSKQQKKADNFKMPAFLDLNKQLLIYEYEIIIKEKKGEEERFLPLFVQSCMNPEQKICYPIIIEFKKSISDLLKCMEEHDKFEIIFYESGVEKRSRVYSCTQVEIMIKKYDGFDTKKTGCIPCRNCGRC